MAEVWILLFALGLWKEQRKTDYSGLILSGSALIPLTLMGFIGYKRELWILFIILFILGTMVQKIIVNKIGQKAK